MLIESGKASTMAGLMMGVLPDMSMIDLYCGAGGASFGYQQAGFKIKIAVDRDPEVKATYEANHPDVEFILADLEDVDPATFSHVDHLHGSPPCPDFSMANKNRDPKRGLQLVKRFEEVLEATRPKWWVMENVPPIAKHIHRGPVYQTIRILNAADYGVPQIRKRVFAGKYPHPRPTHSISPGPTIDGHTTEPWVTVKQALGLGPANPSPWPVQASEWHGAMPPNPQHAGSRASMVLFDEGDTYTQVPNDHGKDFGERTLDHPAYTMKGRGTMLLVDKVPNADDEGDLYLQDALNDGRRSLDLPSFTIRGQGTRHVLMASERGSKNPGPGTARRSLGRRTIDSPGYSVKTEGAILLIDDHHLARDEYGPRIKDVSNLPATTIDARSGGRPFLIINPELPSTTLAGEGRVGSKGHHERKAYPRSRRLTPQQCAALQGFPGDFAWKARTKMALYRMIGNAIPPPVTRAIGRAMLVQT
jgi:site-specific DNA-cytosine methylase